MLPAVLFCTALLLCSADNSTEDDFDDGRKCPDVVDTPQGKMCGPSVFIVGQTKGGTGSLWEWLKEHPDFLPIQGDYLLPKEQRLRVARTMLDNYGEQYLDRTSFSKEEVYSYDVLPIFEHEVEDPEHLTKTNLQRLVMKIPLGRMTRFFCSAEQDILRGLAGGNDTLMNSWYQSIFPSIPAYDESSSLRTMPANIRRNLGRQTGEASPQYMEEWDVSPHLIRNLYPSAKIIILLREPIAKLRSMLLLRREQSFIEGHKVERQKEFRNRLHEFMNQIDDCIYEGHKMPWDPEGCVQHPLGKILRTSHPLKALQEYFEVFPEDDKHLIITSESLWSNPEEGMRLVEEFTGLPHKPGEFWHEITHVHYVPYTDKETGEWHNKHWKETHAHHKMNSWSKYDVPQDFQEFFAEIYKLPNCRLRKLLGVDWSDHGYVYCDKKKKKKKKDDDATNAETSSETHEEEL